MAKKKAVIDANIARADQEKGLLLVLTGNGKGKSSSAFGMVARALGHGIKVGVVQFIKGRSDTGAGPSQAGVSPPGAANAVSMEAVHTPARKPFSANRPASNGICWAGCGQPVPALRPSVA